MSWGYRITFLYLGFVGIIITLVTISSRNKEELVSKDYYAQELAYQDKIIAIKNEKSLVETISYQVTSDEILLRSPFAETKGEIRFFCPSDSKKDKVIAMNYKNGRQSIPTSSLSKGIYKMQLSWKTDNKNFYREEVITIK